MSSSPWIEAMRLRTLPVSVAGVVVGCGAAAVWQSFEWLPALICLVFALLAQIASNFANEYYDYVGGLDKKGREGFRRGVTEGDISPRAMRNATFVTLALACLLGLSLVIWGGWWLIFVGIAIACFAIAYSTGPFPLSRNGLGDVAVIIFFGLVPVTLTEYVQAGAVAFSPDAMLMALAIGLLADTILIVNNYRDADDDRAVGKRTTVVLFGRRFMACVYLIFSQTGVWLCYALAHPIISDFWLIFFSLISLAYALLFKKLVSSSGKALNPVLGMTAGTLLIFAIGYAIALATS